MSEKPKTKCRHEKAYLNVVSRTLKFWVCPKCKVELSGPPPKYPSEKDLEYPKGKDYKKFPSKVTQQYIHGHITSKEYEDYYAQHYYPYYGNTEEDDEEEVLWEDGTF